MLSQTLLSLCNSHSRVDVETFERNLLIRLAARQEELEESFVIEIR